MAGIGFELQKVLREGGVIAFLKVTIAGAVIVAGPWLLSVLGIFTITRVAGDALAEARQLFTATIGYSFATSLILFGGVHYVFTRHVADLIYEEKFTDACGIMIAYLVLTTLAAGGLAALALSQLQLAQVSQPLLFLVSAGVLFVAVNLIWLLMIFISLLKRFMLIFFIYLSGMAASTVGVAVLGRQLQIGGAMLGFAGGQLFIAVALLVLVLVEYRPSFAALPRLFAYFGRQRTLFLTGVVYNWAIWADKVWFWFTVGGHIDGTYLRTFDAYDIAFFFANLTMIPGLIYFVIEAETNFYHRLLDFLDNLGSDPLLEMRKRKSIMAGVLRDEVVAEALFQALFTLTIVFFAVEIAAGLFGGAIAAPVLQITSVGVLAHLMLLTLMIFLFYLELYGASLVAAALFLAINLGGAALTTTLQLPWYGASYLAGATAATIYCAAVLFTRVRMFDRILFTRSG